MTLFPPGRIAKLAKTGVLVLIAFALVYIFSPNQFGTINPQHGRAALDDFTLQSLKGEKWSLRDQRGKVVLVNFWATWCPPCRMETPGLVDLQSKFAQRGFTVAGITMDEDPGVSVPDFVKKYGIQYPILIPGSHSSVADQVEALPTSILIDRSGRVARRFVGMVTEHSLSTDIEALLAEKE